MLLSLTISRSSKHLGITVVKFISTWDLPWTTSLVGLAPLTGCRLISAEARMADSEDYNAVTKITVTIFQKLH